jgi:hypothetical protein
MRPLPIRLHRLVDNNFGVALALTLGAEVALDRGDRQRASRDLEEALPLVRWTGHCGAMATALSARARLAEDEGDRERGRELNNESLDLWKRLDEPGLTLSRRVLCGAARPRGLRPP